MTRPAGQMARAELGWGEDMPPEIRELALACMARTSRAVAKQLGYSDGAISQALANKYQNGDVPKLFAKIRGALMGEVVFCPEQGQIGRDVCLDWQKKPFAATNSHRVRMFHACRECPHRQQKDAS